MPSTASDDRDRLPPGAFRVSAHAPAPTAPPVDDDAGCWNLGAALDQERCFAAIGRLSAGLVHDFNNILTVVIGQTERIIASAAGDERITRLAAATQNAALHGAKLTGRLLAFARQGEPCLEIVALDRHIADIGDFVRCAVGETIAVSVGTEGGLWPCRVDPVLFEAALLNLAINARDAMPGGGRLTITARNAAIETGEAQRLGVAPGGYVVVTVADSGCGMSPDVQRRAFEPCFSTKGTGTGLGLAQVDAFARRVGGSASIDSAVGKGANVFLYLPRAAASDCREPPAPGDASIPSVLR
jgi:signal transduction histidine kinase